MTEFWNKTQIQTQVPAAHQEYQTFDLDEQALSVIQGHPELDLFPDGDPDRDDEEEDTSLLMRDANLRLEQGRLYQMVLQNNIFADTNADPRAIKNVQREIRKYVRERMETMLGIRQEQAKETVVSSPFNDLEVTALKMVASKVTKGATESQAPAQAPVQQAPKRDGITAISGTLRPDGRPPALPVSSNGHGAKPQLSKPQPKKAAPKSALVKEELLTKPIEEMTQDELAAHNAKAAQRQEKNKAAQPPNMVPHPTPQQLEMMYQSAVMQQPLSLSSNRFRPYE